MSLRNTVRALPALVRVGFADAVAYRAEMLIWVLSTTMPLVMLALWSAVAREAPVGRFGQAEFTAYFLCTFVVRQLTGSWSAWEMNIEVRSGTLSQRLLRPVSPIFCYAVENLAVLPMRLIVGLPVAVILLLVVGSGQLPRDWVVWLAWAASMLGAWLITFFINVAIGSMSLFMESSFKVMEVYFAVFMVFSGYLVPVEVFPPFLRRVAAILPFHFQIGFPVELMTSAHARGEALGLLAQQWGYVLGMGLIALALWRRGLRLFAAYGG